MHLNASLKVDKVFIFFTKNIILVANLCSPLLLHELYTKYKETNDKLKVQVNPEPRVSGKTPVIIHMHLNQC